MNLRLVLAGDASGARGSCTPLTPFGFERLKNKFSVEALVEEQRSRIYRDEAYLASGIRSIQKHRDGDWVFAVQPPSPSAVEPHCWYFVSSLGQTAGWSETDPLIARMKTLGCTLIDVERLRDAQGKYKASWGRFPGMLGMADVLRTLGEKLAQSGAESPLGELRFTHEYASPSALLQHLDEVGERISEEGLPEQAYPLMIALIGGGPFESGVDEVLERFPLKSFSVHVVDENTESFSADQYSLYKVVFQEADVFGISGKAFDARAFKKEPELFKSLFDRYLPIFQVVINGSDWRPQMPTLLTREYLRQAAYLHSNPLPKVTADLTGRAPGPLEIVEDSSLEVGSIHTYLPRKDEWFEGVAASGTTVMGCRGYQEVFAEEASTDFSQRMTGVLEELLTLREGKETTGHWVPDWLHQAMVLHDGVGPLVG